MTLGRFNRKYSVEVPRAHGGYVPVVDVSGNKWGTRQQVEAIMRELERRGYQYRMISSKFGTLVRVEHEHTTGATYEETPGQKPRPLTAP